MQLFQKLAPLIALMLLASKEAAALPQPQVPDVATNYPGYVYLGYPTFSGNNAASTIDTVSNQADVAPGNINPNSSDEVELEARQYSYNSGADSTNSNTAYASVGYGSSGYGGVGYGSSGYGSINYKGPNGYIPGYAYRP